MNIEFMLREIWVSTFSAAFQRANVYADSIPTPDRDQFRQEIRAYLEKVIMPQYENPVDKETHIQNIRELVQESSNYNTILRGGQFTFGVAQKLFNLALKFYWSIGLIVEPPHCPIDRLVQEKGLGLKQDEIVSWTKELNEEQYRKIIQAIQEKTDGKISIAQWELAGYDKWVKGI